MSRERERMEEKEGGERWRDGERKERMERMERK